MLQDRSKRIAPSDGRIERLVMVTGRELSGTVVALLILFVLVFPGKKLFEELLARSPDDALSIAYLENLLRSDQDNMDWRLLLAGAQAEHVSFTQLEALLKPVWTHGTEAQQHRARQIHLHGIAVAYQRGTVLMPDDAVTALLQRELADGKNATELMQLAGYAILLDRSELVLNIYRKLIALSPGKYLNSVVSAAKQSLGLGRYRLAADLYFLARQNASGQSARLYFRLGIGALMADNRYREAIQAADRFLGNLNRDAETLRFLIRTSRAADSSSRAARYARMLLELESER